MSLYLSRSRDILILFHSHKKEWTLGIFNIAYSVFTRNKHNRLTLVPYFGENNTRKTAADFGYTFAPIARENASVTAGHGGVPSEEKWPVLVSGMRLFDTVYVKSEGWSSGHWSPLS